MPERVVHISQLVADLIETQEERGDSNRTVANALHISPTTLTNWYSGGTVTLTGENLYGLCEYLQIGPGDVLERLGWVDGTTGGGNRRFHDGLAPLVAAAA